MPAGVQITIIICVTLIIMTIINSYHKREK